MQLIGFSATGWESWDVGQQPLIRDRMPVLIDDDLRFEDAPGVPRPAVFVNRWLRELPLNGAQPRALGRTAPTASATG